MTIIIEIHRPDKASNIQMPDFTNEELSEKYGHKQSLKYIDRLKHGRPCQAVTDLYNKNKKLTPQIKRNACISVHGYALYHIDDLIVSASSIAFIEMLGNDSQLLRTHIACAAIIQKNKNYNEENLKSLLYKVVTNTKGAAEEFLREVENALYEQWKDESDTFQCLQQNQLPVLLASLHGLPPPYIALKYAATSNNWLLFILTAQIFKYPVDKVQEMVSEFSCQNIREHLYYALALTITEPYDLNSVLSGELSLDKIKVGPNNCKLERESDLFVNICQCKNDPEKMLKISREVGNPVLALLATYLKPKSMTDVFCTWLATSIEKGKVPATLDEPWTPAKVLNILELAVQLGYIRTVERAFTIYFSENPLHIFSSFLVDTVEEKNFEDSILKVKSFKAACLNLPDKVSGRVIGFMNNRSWIANAAIKMASVALAYCFKSLYMQNKFLNILVESQISHHLSVPTPDYAQFLRLSNCLAHTDIKLDYIRLCIEDNRSQLSQHLILLIEKKDFQTAFQFASTCGLPLDSVHIANWTEKAKKVERQDKQFWNECQTALLRALVEPQIAADFFKSQADSITSPKERFVFLKYTLEWMSKVPTKDKNLLEESQVQLELYLSALEEDFDIQLLTEDISYIPLRYLTTDLENRSAQTKCLHSLNSEQHYKLESLIHKLLGVGDIMTVVSLQDIFKHRNQDYDLLVACMSLAEGIPIQQMPQMVKDILGNDLFYSTTMQKLPVSSPRCKKENLTIVNLEEQQQVLNALYALQAHQSCVTPMFRNIICGFKVASALGLDYKTVITHPEPLSLLHIDDDFEIACNVFTLAALTESEFTQYLAEQLTSVIHLGPVEPNNYVLWGCELDSQFSRLLQGINSLMLGNLLLSSVPNLDTKQPNTLREGVELLILSHTCFTKACNMEGISKILTMCGDIVNLLHDCCQWALMVHLITGIGRYTEMKYIFQILKDSHQFEFLLGKGLDKYTGLKSSLLDFVRNDKTQYMLVAVHFRMYSELAMMFSDEAKYLLGELVKGPEGSLVRSEANKQCLQAAMNKYADATNHYMQANKQKKGVMCIQQAELVALQLSLFNSIPPPQIVYCLINLTPDQVTALVMSFLSYDQACIVAAAYNLVIDWGAALYHHCIVQGQTSYLNAWCQHNNFTLTIVQDVARRFQNSKLANSNMEINMKWFLSAVSQVDIRYRICSQLGFKDLLETILSGPDLAYLKDTIFQKGIKNQEL
uniref:Spatacsin C-terminal domain-containing protein n=1 Tax=Clastoptera arizonana TaxID=38151 RepID=A0A1B6BXG2_9HEMI